jgi:hypothetical protein
MTIANREGIAPTDAVQNSRLTKTYRVSDFSSLVFVWTGRSRLCVYHTVSHEGPEQWFHRDTVTVADKPSEDITRADVHAAISAFIRAYERRQWTREEDI